MSTDNILESLSNSARGIVQWVIDYIGHGFLSIMDLDFEVGASADTGNYLPTFFPFLTELTKICMAAAMVLALILFIFSILKNIYCPPNEAQNPLNLIFRFAACMLLIYFAPVIVSDIVYKPLQVLIDLTVDAYDAVEIAAENSWWENLIDGITEKLHAAAANILLIILQVAVFWSYIKLLLCALERWVVCGILYYTSPLAMSMGVSKSTENVLKSWVRMLVSSALILMMNMAFIYAYQTSRAYVQANSYDYHRDGMNAVNTNYRLLFCWVQLAVLKVGRQVDQYMSSLGVSVASTAQNLGGELLAAGAMLGSGLRGIRGAYNSGLGAAARTKIADKMAASNSPVSQKAAEIIRPKSSSASAGNTAQQSQKKQEQSNSYLNQQMNHAGVKSSGEAIDNAVTNIVQKNADKLNVDPNTTVANAVTGDCAMSVADSRAQHNGVTADLVDANGNMTGEKLMITSNKADMAAWKEMGGTEITMPDGSTAVAMKVADAPDVNPNADFSSYAKASDMLADNGFGGTNLAENREMFDKIDQWAESGGGYDAEHSGPVGDSAGSYMVARNDGSEIVVSSQPLTQVNDSGAVMGTMRFRDGEGGSAYVSAPRVPCDDSHGAAIAQAFGISPSSAHITPVTSTSGNVVGFDVGDLTRPGNPTYRALNDSMTAAPVGAYQTVSVENGEGKAPTSYSVQQMSAPANIVNGGMTDPAHASTLANNYAAYTGTTVTEHQDMGDGNIRCSGIRKDASGNDVATSFTLTRDDSGYTARMDGDTTGESSVTYLPTGQYQTKANATHIAMPNDGAGYQRINTYEKDANGTLVKTSLPPTVQEIPRTSAQSAPIVEKVNTFGMTPDNYLNFISHSESAATNFASSALNADADAHVSKGYKAAQAYGKMSEDRDINVKAKKTGRNGSSNHTRKARKGN